jgi:hypothetical protein
MIVGASKNHIAMPKSGEQLGLRNPTLESFDDGSEFQTASEVLNNGNLRVSDVTGIGLMDSSQVCAADGIVIYHGQTADPSTNQEFTDRRACPTGSNDAYMQRTQGRLTPPAERPNLSIKGLGQAISLPVVKKLKAGPHYSDLVYFHPPVVLINLPAEFNASWIAAEDE